MLEDILDLARPEIKAMQAYSSARKEDSKGTIWLNANENPWQVSKKQFFNRYPAPQPPDLLNKLANLYRVKSSQLLITRGSDEGIDVLMRTFCNAADDSILICPPTYGMYKISATIQNAKIIETPLQKSDFCLDVPAISASIIPDTKLIFLCSPNNPTGNLLKEEKILQLCTTFKKNIFVVDEAYIEFSMAKSLSRYVKYFPNLIILRTLSKAYGLASLRCGVVIAQAEIIELLKKVIAPYPIPEIVADKIIQCLQASKLAKIKTQINCLLEERQSMLNFLTNIDCVKKVYPSDSNFLLVRFNDAKAILNLLKQQGIIVRDRSQEYGLSNCLRITIGSKRENSILKKGIQNA